MSSARNYDKTICKGLYRRILQDLVVFTSQFDEINDAPDGVYAMVDAFSKYGVPLAENLQNVVEKKRKREIATASTFPLKRCDAKFSVPTQIGRPGCNIFNLIFDTFASGIWVHSPETANPQALQALQTASIPQNTYSSRLIRGYTWEDERVDGTSASGILYGEAVSVGSLTVKDQALQVAETVPDYYQTLQSIFGVMGMGFDSLSTIPPTTQRGLFDSALPQLDLGVFTVDMKHCSSSQVDFGHIDDNAYNGVISTTDGISDRGYWNFTARILGDIDINLFDTIKLDDKGMEYVVDDTASELMMLPLKYNVDYYMNVEGAHYRHESGGYVIPCTSELPKFTFESGFTRVTIPGRYMKLNRVDEKEDLCFGVLQSSDALGVNILGGPTFKSAFVIFHPVKKAID
ncbi:uncharacterized protein BROUX77_005382 [Berkeleyomyces rouxiae]|uniref:uncharacterized protein n=1 Tax=Berkeleyomyces rouxiae TaxID=2035830 RepID=UPI003B7CD9EE